MNSLIIIIIIIILVAGKNSASVAHSRAINNKGSMELTTTTHHDCAPYSAIQVRSIQKNSLFGASTGVCGCGSASCYFCIELLAPVSHPRSTTACVGSTGVPGR
ncbi:hypothetical protein C8Q69DRAFT_451558 [Paecilomyces variotii]|uniref:Secreted protein n=1 Tax=Byssochlamys spectabilis TaxID=264951 RepID=A0A443I664_BYSSP|nr:hypothetical protein C8Q69DRAFT_451558 [Paecilomyces variotii]RWQ99542.1 hypothetical protein C8Q69DRAFT_451558 [Paecilomyces variotii]